jgi:hypothetical protein
VLGGADFIKGGIDKLFSDILSCFEVLRTTKERTDKVGFVAFPATEYDEVLLGYQLGQMVEQ